MGLRASKPIRAVRQLFAFALFIGIVTASMPARADPSADLANFLSAQAQRCRELTRLRDELAQKAQSGPVDAKTKQDLTTLNSLVDGARKLTEQPLPQTPAEREALAETIYNVAMAANMAVHDVRRDLREPESSVAARALPSNISDFTTKVSKGFDGSAQSYNPDVNSSQRLRATDFFVWSGQSQPAATPAVSSALRPTTASEATRIVKLDGGVDGGVVLEGSATDLGPIPGLGPITKVQYDSSLNALVLNDQVTYFIRIPPWITAVLSRKIAVDPNGVVGVSLTGENIVVSGTGDTDSFQDTDLTHDLVLADRFLGDIAFGENDWSAGYRFAKEYKTQTTNDFPDMVVRFAFEAFQFQAEQGKLHPTRANLEIRLIPISKSSAANGAMLPDGNALAKGFVPPEAFAVNVRNISDNVDYYRRERIVSRVFAYGETAALFRAFKAARIDLERLGRAIGTSTDDVRHAGEVAAAAASAGPTSASAPHGTADELNRRNNLLWASYLKEIQADGPEAFPNWSGPPYDLFVKRQAEVKARSGPTYRVVNVAADDALNMRSGPDSSYTIVGQIPHNGQGVRLGNGCKGPWCPAAYGSAVGWVNSSYLAADSNQDSTYRVVHVAANDALNIRRGPAVRYPILNIIPPDGRGVRILKTAECEATWCQVDYNGAQGWVNTLFLADEQGGEPTYRVISVAGGDVLNIRSGPSADLAIVSSIPPDGRGVRIVGACTGQWCPIEFNGIHGWVNRQYLAGD
jgi:uncharacterized protein YraI